MSTIKIENRPNANGQRELTKEQFIEKYSKVVKEHGVFSKDVLEFSELMAKHPADVFIVTSFEPGKACEQIRQGDIYLFRAGDAEEEEPGAQTSDSGAHTAAGCHTRRSQPGLRRDEGSAGRVEGDKGRSSRAGYRTVEELPALRRTVL